MTDEPTSSDTQFAIQAKAGDRDAFEKLVQLHKGPLYRFVRRYTGNDADAYDVVQDSFISCWMAIGRYDGRTPFGVWLRAIALNKCRDHGRREGVKRRFLRLFGIQAPLPHTIDPEDVECAREETESDALRLQRLDQAIANLPTFYKEPLLLTTVSGLSQQQTAEQLNTTTKAIEMRLRRARKHLNEALADVKKAD